MSKDLIAVRASSAGDITPNAAGMAPPLSRMVVFTDMRFISDDIGHNCDPQYKVQVLNCKAEDFIRSTCTAMAGNVPAALRTEGVKQMTWDYQQGARTPKALDSLMHHVATAVPLQGMNTAVDVSAGAGTGFMAPVWSYDSGLVVAGFQLNFTRQLQTVQQTIITVSTDPGFQINGKQPFPPVGLTRSTPLLRGNVQSSSQGSLQFALLEGTGAVALAWMYRPVIGMDTAQIDVGRCAPIPKVDAYDYFFNSIPGPDAALPPAVGFSVAVAANNTLSSVEIVPITNNNKFALAALARLIHSES